MSPEKHSYTVVRRMSRIGDERGFNLVEMTVVILILAVLVAIAVPIFMRDTRAGDKATAVHNLSAGERLYDYVWYDRLASQNTPDGVNSYRDYNPPEAVKGGSFYQSHGYALVDAQYMSIA
ncbi:MAG TPA: prepilin-type N-terminal cleavage/methylation domain-containing protein, partial [Candidatus Anoxymicrobiaceae bacterium]